MRGFLTVFRREVEERRLLLGMAFLLGLFPLAVPFLPGVSASGADDARVATALGLATITSALLAVLLGASVTAGDLFAGRMSFYFFRPLSGWAIWGGKLAATLALSMAGALLILAPALLANGGLGESSPFDTRNAGPDPAASVLLWGIFLLFLVAISQVAAVSLRNRSPWVAVDLAALAVAVAIGWSCWRELRDEGLTFLDIAARRAGQWTTLAWITLGFGIVLLAGLLAAGAAQVVAGRTDPRRGHRRQSLTLWGLVALALAGLVGATRWATDVTPRDLRFAIALVGEPRGPWLWVMGSPRNRPGFYPSLFVNAETGRFVRTRVSMTAFYGNTEPQFSEDGRTVAWMEPVGNRYGLPIELKTLDLTDPRSQPRSTGAVFSPRPGTEGFYFRLSPDGRLLAVLNGDRLTVEDLKDHKLLSAGRIEADDYLVKVLWFEGTKRLRVDLLNQYSWGRLTAQEGRTKVTLYSLDLASGALSEVGKVEPVAIPGGFWWRDANGDRAVLAGHNVQEVRDGSTGAFLAAIEGRPLASAFVPGGLVVAQEAPQGRQVRLFDRDGKVEKGRLSLPQADRLAIWKGEKGEGAEVFASEPKPVGRITLWKRWRVDPERGTFEPLPPLRLLGLQPGLAWDREALRRADGIAWSWYPSSPVRIFLPPPF